MIQTGIYELMGMVSRRAMGRESIVFSILGIIDGFLGLNVESENVVDYDMVNALASQKEIEELREEQSHDNQ